MTTSGDRVWEKRLEIVFLSGDDMHTYGLALTAVAAEYPVYVSYDGAGSSLCAQRRSQRR